MRLSSNHFVAMSSFVRTFMLSLILAFSAMSVVGPAVAANMNFEMAKSMLATDEMVGAALEMRDCAEQSASKTSMANCDVVCSATAAFSVVLPEEVVFSEPASVADHLMFDVRAEGRTLTYDSPPPRNLILI